MIMRKSKPSKCKVCQFRTHILFEGGGEQVMRAMYKAVGARIYTILKEIKGSEFVELGSELDRKVAQTLLKE